jgi:hypothetical protein
MRPQFVRRSRTSRIAAGATEFSSGQKAEIQGC